TTLAIFQPNRENPYYYFTADTPVYLKNGAGQYEPANIYLPGVEYYVRTEYFDQLVPGYLAYSFTPVDQAVTRIAAGPDGVPYVPAGEHRAAAAIAMKTENRTESYAFRQEASALGQFQLVLLGNNGRIEIRDLARLSARKVWEGSPLDSVWVRLYADGAPIRAAVQLNAANSWRYTWDELLQYPVKAEADGTVARIAYTVAEGSFENGIFTPYGASHTPEGYHIRYSQPAWDDVTGWSEAVITDRAPDYVELKGLPPPSQEPESEPSNPPETPETSEPQEIPALPQTGDGAIPALWLAAMAAGAAALISAVKRYGKK
ncbi:MAG: Cna B-type domain-containing protein, partial [Firmicutes bacterium]|nr:Cna B-type domain-containing protein [Bacillota bacterium]